MSPLMVVPELISVVPVPPPLPFGFSVIISVVVGFLVLNIGLDI
jgi:hypothetical protein